MTSTFTSLDPKQRPAQLERKRKPELCPSPQPTPFKERRRGRGGRSHKVATEHFFRGKKQQCQQRQTVMSSICRNNNNSDNNCNFSVRDSKDDDEKSPPQLAVTSGSRSPSLSVDDFEILGRVGGGGFGEVHMVRHIHKNKIFAMKVLKKNLVTKKNYKRHHLLAERNVMAWADSPWVVQLSYSFQDDVNLYLVMELLQGGDLFERWKVCGECMPENEVRFYIAELAAAVNSVHEMNFVHRDLKPDNILIDNEGHIKLTDFGLSSHVTATADANELPDALRLSLARRRSFDCLNCAKRIICQHAKLFSAVGTVEYTAPEVLAGSSEGYSPSKCDWWSVGIIMFQLLTGDVPFASESQVLDHRYHLSLVRRGISREARSLLKK
eukprot:TRINITY_DN5231_c0_g1_i1.p1 TRINITY_DN5231_c0_g1~~TRINITY_DN5231_c0_g1_i1.p1  ORF type:complete len:382 (+),score=66.59 TRINITY_DN5231_c0_g1_i1:908-2053(+)